MKLNTQTKTNSPKSTRGLNSPFTEMLPHGIQEQLASTKPSSFQLPLLPPRKRARDVGPAGRRRSDTLRYRKLQVSELAAKRTINLDLLEFGPTACEFMDLDPHFWSTDSPFLAKATAVYEATSIYHPLLDRYIWGRGKAEQRALLYLLRGSRIVALEQPFRVRYNGSLGVPDLITAPDVWFEQGEITPWEESTIWEIKETSLFQRSTSAKRAREHLKRQVERCLALADAVGCKFRVVVVEIPYRPQAPDTTSFAAEYGCSMLVISATEVRNLMLLKRHEVLLARRDDSLLDAWLTLASTTPEPLAVQEVAERLGVPVGKMSYILLHAAQHGVCTFDMSANFDVSTTRLWLHEDWVARTERLRTHLFTLPGLDPTVS